MAVELVGAMIPFRSNQHAFHYNQLVGATILKSTPLPPESKNNLVVHLIVFNRAAFNLHVPSLYAFLPATTPSNIISGLSCILFYFPHLPGRITSDDHLRPCIFLGNFGVRLAEANVSTSL
ncbi:hypothetical protein KSP39_PZI016753 [Platanthera zijinensis]|uniref:Uncharacterized protein n=1 Tax=Platanthera zijinensis TaxID=2320716 RepID=A0AAP0G0W7_9ASPA